jgi:hypothetical protein
MPASGLRERPTSTQPSTELKHMRYTTQQTRLARLTLSGGSVMAGNDLWGRCVRLALHLTTMSYTPDSIGTSPVSTSDQEFEDDIFDNDSDPHSNVSYGGGP